MSKQGETINNIFIKQSVINTFNRVKIPYKALLQDTGTYEAVNRFSGETVKTNLLFFMLVNWIYNVSNDYELGINNVRLDDFDRIRYFILSQAKDVYNTCID